MNEIQSKESTQQDAPITLKNTMFNITIICKRAPKNVGDKAVDNYFPVGDDPACILGKNNLPKFLLKEFY